jgi:hypothetical protein
MNHRVPVVGTSSEQPTRRKALWLLAKAAAFCSLFALELPQVGCGGSAVGPSSAPAGFPGTDNQLLDDIERAGFLYFWEQADPTTGQVKDRALANCNDTRTVSSIAATGFGLTALAIGDQRGYRSST